MKGIMLSVVLWIHSMVIIVGLVWMVSYEHTRYHVVSAHKNALRSTMVECSTIDCDENQVMAKFTAFIKPSLLSFQHVSWDLMGYHQEPLLIRFVVKVVDSTSIYPFTITSDEAMIQEIEYD